MNIVGAMDAIRQLVFQIDGIETSYLDVPEIAPDDNMLPAAIVRINPEDAGIIELGNMEVWIAKIRVDVIIRRVGDIQKESEISLAFLPQVVEVLRANQTLDGNGTILADMTWNIGHLQLHNETFYGSSVALSVEDLLDVSALISE